MDPDGAPLSIMGDWIPFGDKITFGHSGALVGNDEDGWLFYSNNGPNGTSVGLYSSVEEFREKYNSQGKNFNFSQEQRLSTTPEQDQSMKSKALELAGTTMEKINSSENNYLVVSHSDEKPYRTLTNNCSQNVAAIAAAGGQASLNTLIPRLQVLVSPETNKQVQRARILQTSVWW
jgi:hypothetical protein